MTRTPPPRPRSRADATRDCCSGLSRLLTPALFRALCDPNRVAILIRLAERAQPSSVSEVAACCPIDLSVVSRHLTTLRVAGIVEAERRGRQVFYSVASRQLAQNLREIADAFEACCPASRARGSSTRPPTPRTHKEKQDAARRA